MQGTANKVSVNYTGGLKSEFAAAISKCSQDEPLCLQMVKLYHQPF